MKTKKYITLYHYTNKKISGVLSPAYFGDNYFTANDKNICNIKRLFFYDVKKAESLLSNSRYIYHCKIDKSKIYDLRADKSGYIKRYDNISVLLNAIIDKKFNGVIYSIGNYNIVCLFKSIKPLTVEALS